MSSEVTSSRFSSLSPRLFFCAFCFGPFRRLILIIGVFTCMHNSSKAVEGHTGCMCCFVGQMENLTWLGEEGHEIWVWEVDVLLIHLDWCFEWLVTWASFHTKQSIWPIQLGLIPKSPDSMNSSIKNDSTKLAVSCNSNIIISLTTFKTFRRKYSI